MRKGFDLWLSEVGGRVVGGRIVGDMVQTYKLPVAR